MTLLVGGKPYRPEPFVPYEFAGQAQPFPKDVFPRIIGQAIDDVCRVDQAPVEIVAMGALAVISIAVQNRINVVRSNRPASPVSLNLLNVSQSGDGKTIVEENFLSVITDFEKEKELANGNSSDGKEAELSYLQLTEGDLKYKIKNATKLKLSPEDLKKEWFELQNQIKALRNGGHPQSPWIYSDATFEGLRRALEGERRAVGVVSFDAGGVLNGMLTTNSPQLNNLWDGKDLVVQLASGTSRIRDPRLSMFLAVQPNELAVFLEKPRGGRALGNGFFSRFLYAESTPRLVQISRGAKPAVEAFKKQLRAILESPGTDSRQEVAMDEKATEYWNGYFDTMRRAAIEVPWAQEIAGFVKKLPEQAARIAALFYYFERHDSLWPEAKLAIDWLTMRKAAQLCDWFMHTHRAAFSIDGEARKKKVQAIADTVLKKIADKFNEKQRQSLPLSIPPYIDNSLRIRNVDSGALFTWNQQDRVIAYTKRHIHNHLYECDYVLLDEALDILNAEGKICIAPGLRDGKVILYTGPYSARWPIVRDWTTLLPTHLLYRRL
jgi:hypothetical protein